MGEAPFRQEPMAVVGFACRLPGGNTTPHKLWQFLERGDIASNDVPKTRFNIDGHYDGSQKPGTMRLPGGMFLEDIDPADFDASFFEIGGREAIAMDPNQRQILEVAFEALENAGIPLERISGQEVGCYIGSYASDYGDMQNRDAADKPINHATGVGRSILANRLSYFLNIKGPSITLDTACSGSLVALDLACRSLQSGETRAALVSASNLYLNPDHAMDPGTLGQAYSPTARCHTFDAAADGYVKAEAVSCIILKRLSDALRERDPVRAIIRGTSSNSNGRTAGIASPSWEAQAAAIRRAYANAGLTNLDDTSYLECHGTGTQAGDLNEVQGAGSVFARTRAPDRPLIIGSIKSNVGHAEPAAGNSGLIKVILSMEKGIIPGTPTFVNPNPKIDFATNRVKVSRTPLRWPTSASSFPRRASINSFGFGGSNAHAVVDSPEASARNNHVSSYRDESDPEMNPFDDDREADRPHVCVLSANDPTSLRSSIRALCAHLSDPRVGLALPDLAYTLSERRTHLWHAAFVSARGTDVAEKDFVVGHRGPPRPAAGIAMVFTGQGAQWPRMGRDLLRALPWTRGFFAGLDDVLRREPQPPAWSIVGGLTRPCSAEEMRRPELSQTLVTALQLCIVDVLRSWGVRPRAVVGHSSGEIAAACAAGLLDREGAIRAAFYRGRAATDRMGRDAGVDGGMLAVGLGEKAASVFLRKHVGHAWIACFNGPDSITVSGRKSALEEIKAEVTAAGHFARLLLVDLAYHSPMMDGIADGYISLLTANDHSRPQISPSDVVMYSSVTATRMDGAADPAYWKANMVSPVRFHEALDAVITDIEPSMIVEIGPSGALAGPVSQILKSRDSNIVYQASWRRGEDAAKSLFDVAGRLYVTGAPVDMCRVNAYDMNTVRTIVDLPNYSWNHSVKYWHENAASRDWRFKKFTTHEILGSKIPGTLWSAPTWRHRLILEDVPWLRDHHMGPDILMPGAGHATLAIEAMHQTYRALHPEESISLANELAYRLRNVKFKRAMVIEEDRPAAVVVSLLKVAGSKDWHEFKVMTEDGDVVHEHSSGMIRVQEPIGDDEALGKQDLTPLRHPQSSRLWYQVQREVGVDFGPAFQKLQQIEVVSGRRDCRALLSLEPPVSKWDPATYYPLHPAVLDACFQTATPANVGGERSTVKEIMLPASIDDMVVNKVRHDLGQGLSVARSEYTGRGRRDQFASYAANVAVHDPANGALFMRVRGLKYVRLDASARRDPHVFHSVTWKPDMACLDRDTLPRILPSEYDQSRIMYTIDLIAHRDPTLRVLELNLDEGDASSHWFEGSDGGVRAAYARYDFASIDSQAVVAAQEIHGFRGSGFFHHMSAVENAADLFAKGGLYGLIIVKATKGTDFQTNGIIKHLQTLLGQESYLLIDHRTEHKPPMNGHATKPQTNGPEPNRTDDPISSSPPEPDNILTALGTLSLDPHAPTIHLFRHPPPSIHPSPPLRPIEVLQLSPSPNPSLPSLQTHLSKSGHPTSLLPQGTLPTDPNSLALIADELSTPLLRTISAPQWQTLQDLTCGPNPVLWLTGDTSARPDLALVRGLFRTIRRERGTKHLAILELEDRECGSAVGAVVRGLEGEKGDWAEAEYRERDGVVCVSRVVPDGDVNGFRAAGRGRGLEPVERGLFATGAQVRLRAERVGALEGLVWGETGAEEGGGLEEGMVEVEVRAVGVNFKDVATTMGLVPENEHMIGCECAGVVRRVAAGVERFRPGDRVVTMRNGTYVNHDRFPEERVHHIPTTMSFDDAATIPLVYLTAIYSLYHLANLREGQTVLIHSAAGGVGLAAIQLARYRKAEVYVTVGTDEKRDFLADTFGIPLSHISNSRTARFAEDIRRATDGRGVDVVLNSLTGELLDESWRLLADGGIFVEIGKRDIVDRNLLAMDPFDRNCSFRAVDLSYDREITDALIGRLLNEIFTLVDGGHIEPIRPVRKFSFDQVIPALSYMRRGQHIGKIVISREEADDVRVPIRPAIRQLRLRSDAAYIIVGGLKGLCGSIAVHLARHGARRLIVMSRSGVKDQASDKIIRDCAAYDCEILEAQGDVTDFEFVRRVFQRPSAQRIGGVIQGAMVLRDKPFESMTQADFHEAIHAKTVGTWNLHIAALQELDAPLEFFTMLSSLSGIVGNKGQANYAAANTFLDAFAEYRQSIGLRAHTLDLGAVQDVGYLADQDDALMARLDRRQWTPIAEDVLRDLLTLSILQQSPSTQISRAGGTHLITGLAHPLPSAAASDLTHDRRFACLTSDNNRRARAQDAGVDEGDGTDRALDHATKAFRKTLASGAPAPALAEASVNLLRDRVTSLLRLETAVEPAKPLTSYGLDSLSAVELRAWLRQNTGAELSTLDITNASSLVALGDKLVARLPEVEGGE